MSYDKLIKPKYIYHYTTIEGCQGILESQTLHASNISFLNDRKEIRYVDEFVSELIREKFRTIFAELVQKKIMTVPVDVGMLAEHEAASFLNAIHRTSRKLSPTFVVSFCRATSEFVEKNGILSQWRGYGQDGGIALRFDVEGLEAICKAETEKYSLMTTFVGDVIYGQDDPEFGEIKGELDVFAKAVPDVVEGMLAATGVNHILSVDKVSLDKLHRPYAAVAPRLKHPGFSEEVEYRLAVSVWTGAANPEDPEINKKILFKKRSNYLLPYIKINESGDGRLPISQIIVGPSTEMERRTDSIRSLVRECRLDVEVRESEIPFA